LLPTDGRQSCYFQGMSDVLRLGLAPPRATITFDNPKKHNALVAGDLLRLAEILDDIDRRDDLRAVVLTGAGKSFCAGVDIGTLGENHWKASPLDRLTARIESLRQPVVAAINGGVFGGGADIALACDFRIGVAGTRMFVPPARLGIHYPLPGLERLVARLGPSIAKRIMIANETFDAETLVQVGWLDKLVPADSLTEAVDELVERLVSLAPLAVQGMKQTINAIARGDVDAEAVRDRVKATLASADHKEGLAAFAEKRPPIFKGI